MYTRGFAVYIFGLIMGNRVFMDILYFNYKIITEIVIKNLFILTLGDNIKFYFFVKLVPTS